MAQDRKKDHIELAGDSQTGLQLNDQRFNYEPLLSAHPKDILTPFPFLGKTMRIPLWISSMTGGTAEAMQINRNLAIAAGEFGMGMGLGSGRILLEDKSYPEHFMLRQFIGKEAPLYANLGIAQIEKAVLQNDYDPIRKMIDKLDVDGLIIHVNPIQEWLQPEGDRLKEKPIDMISEFLNNVSFRVIVKEVGQGMGPESLKTLTKLPLQAIDFAAFGGTNFARLELLRGNEKDREIMDPLSHIGNIADEMLDAINLMVEGNEQVNVKELIISGGVKTFLDGFYYIKKSKLPAIYGQASTFLSHARGDYESLKRFVEQQIRGLEIAYSYLQLK